MSRVVVVGGGIAGLIAAWRLRRAGKDVVLLEKTQRTGGLIETEHCDGFVFEHGPDGFLASRGDVLAELDALGLNADVVTHGPAPRRAFVSVANGLAPLPGGLFRFERRAIGTMLASPLLSWSSKLRLLVEPFVRSRPSPDEDVESFFTRRMGPEVARHIVDPMLRGIYGAPASELGMRTTMPKLAEMERRFGSLGLALVTARRSASTVGLATLRHGMASLVERVTSSLESSLRLGMDVTRVRSASGGLSVEGSFGTLDADGIVLACPAHAAARLVDELDPQLAEGLADIPFSRADVVGLAYASSDIPRPLDGTGFVVGPDSEASALVACTWSSRKWPDRAPDGSVLLRCVAQMPHATDEELVESVRRDLRQSMGIDTPPRRIRVRRRARALPTYRPGHFEHVASLRERARSVGRIELAGNAYDGVGVPDCVASGRRAASALAA